MAIHPDFKFPVDTRDQVDVIKIFIRLMDDRCRSERASTPEASTPEQSAQLPFRPNLFAGREWFPDGVPDLD